MTQHVDRGRNIITVDFGLSLAAMIAAGKYDRVNLEITAERFPVVGSGVVVYETKLFYINSIVSSDEVDGLIRRVDPACPWGPSRHEHTLAFGAAYPELQRKHPIIGLGSSVDLDGRRCVVCLDRCGAGRYLDLDRWDNDWSTYCCFLAVRPLIV